MLASLARGLCPRTPLTHIGSLRSPTRFARMGCVATLLYRGKIPPIPPERVCPSGIPFPLVDVFLCSGAYRDGASPEVFSSTPCHRQGEVFIVQASKRSERPHQLVLTSSAILHLRC